MHIRTVNTLCSLHEAKKLLLSLVRGSPHTGSIIRTQQALLQSLIIPIRPTDETLLLPAKRLARADIFDVVQLIFHRK
jgi:hypothetical protein